MSHARKRAEQRKVPFDAARSLELDGYNAIETDVLLACQLPAREANDSAAYKLAWHTMMDVATVWARPTRWMHRQRDTDREWIEAAQEAPMGFAWCCAVLGLDRDATSTRLLSAPARRRRTPRMRVEKR